MLLDVKYLTELLRILCDVAKDYSNRKDIPDKILHTDDLNYIISRIEALREILLLNESRVNIIFRLIKFIITTRKNN